MPPESHNDYDTETLEKAFVCRRMPPDVEAAMAARFRVDRNESDALLSPAAIAERARDVSVLFVTATERIDGELLRNLSPALKTVATLSVGHDHIDLATARELGIDVLHTPDVLSDACAEVAMMLLLNAARRGYEADRMVRGGQWPGWAPTQLLGKGLVGKRLGIFGMGRIGRAIATRARAFGMRIHYHNRSRLPAELEDGAIYHATLADLCVHSDMLMVAAPGAPQLKGALDAAHIAALPRGAVVANISRGDIVSDDALIAALQSGHVFAAGLDVFANEPNLDPRYRQLDNVFLSPHIGSATEETRNAMGWLLLDGLAALRRGERPANLISAEANARPT
ncbi:2-hydroxyacid dehydrogenase [Cupriavidus plantarum]|uniref:2-hydroxyacid dehydrogenase n=1 Tax=Cupriavidus plantarum TaxID=942865 RepID=UPI001B0FFF74|nr:D-glycerate dehydrogenase [Cupriavidus plantarum]CAG2148560.1 Glycerate dehydrogenase [Cupriavidus plantarum]SMR85314.1 glyoxylate reductase [Cupriavidus plantarum]